MNPAFGLPEGMWLTGVYSEVVELCVRRAILRKFRVGKPGGGKLLWNAGKVQPAKDTQFEHLLGCQFWLKAWVEIAFHRFKYVMVNCKQVAKDPQRR